MTKQEQIIIILLILAGLIGTGLLYHRKFCQVQVTPEVIKIKDRKEGARDEAEGAREVVVDVKGACWQPGIYTFSYGARVKDAIERACPREDADLNNINLARRLKDGERILIPPRAARSESPGATTLSPDPARDSFSTGEKVNINTASVEELQRLPQIGPKIAGYIVAYRNTHGQFSEISEIKNVERIGEETFKKIKDLITVE